jgi:hypothetical protein
MLLKQMLQKLINLFHSDQQVFSYSQNVIEANVAETSLLSEF